MTKKLEGFLKYFESTHASLSNNKACPRVSPFQPISGIISLVLSPKVHYGKLTKKNLRNVHIPFQLSIRIAFAENAISTTPFECSCNTVATSLDS
jgi:hypothetical protein